MEVEPLSVLSVAYCTVVANQSIYIYLSIFLCPRPVYSTLVTALGTLGLQFWIGFILFSTEEVTLLLVFPLSMFRFFLIRL